MRKPVAENDLPDKTDAVPSGEQSDATEGQSAKKNTPPHRVIKRRTKTGCLTCRQRRIKCSEEKPVCYNCIKSRRECKGYAQRVVFKDPVGINGSNFLATNNAQLQQSSSMRTSFASGYERRFPHQKQAPSEFINTSASQPSVKGMTGKPADTNQRPNRAPLQYLPAQLSHASHPSVRDAPYLTHPAFTPVPVLPQQHLHAASWSSDSHSSPKSASSLGLSAQEPACRPSGQVHSTPSVPTVLSHGPAYATGHPLLTASVSQPLEHQPWNPDIAHTQVQHSFSYSRTHSSPCAATRAIYSDHYGGGGYHSTVDEQSNNETWQDGSMKTANCSELQLGSLTTHLNEPNILASYRPTIDSSPLNDPKAAKIFVHFIHSIGPFLSVFERHPVDSPIALGASVPAAQQGLWTYTLPFQALEHQALLQAMLAISSLHISFLQQAPKTVSLKHYHYALKRVGSAVGLPTRRQQCGTLAATLLLGYYEVVAADHTKWNSHVAGSAQLVREIDYAGLTRDLRAHRRRVQAQRGHMTQSDWWLINNPHVVFEDDPFAEKESSIDEDLIGIITGRAINYDEYGQIENGSSQPYQKQFTRKDIENFRIQCDLYWWYCKQDTIQSIISGNRIFMPYYKWAQCPPRAGMGHLDAIYGSADHLWLLLGRLTDFGYRDRKRKLKAAKVSGTNWKPHPGFLNFMARFAGGSSSMRGAPPRGPSSSAQDNRGPHSSPSSGNDTSPPKEGSFPMYGMVPPRGPVQLPLAFQNNAPHPMSSSDQDDDEEDTTYSDAEDEWERILAAFDTFAYALGHDFMPLPDPIPPTFTPFGRTLQYRTQTIAVLWGFYYTGRILLLRLHPSMPPAMMVAAGVAASATAAYAQTIGKIAASVYNPQLLNIGADRLSPTQGSYLVEMTVPVFFAAVQYTDPGQREWTVVNLRNVSRLTGWKSSDSIASGCERAWVIAGKQGRGPPYQPTGEARRQPTTDLSIQQGPYPNTERRFVTVSKSNRLHWAMGILSLEDDVEV